LRDAVKDKVTFKSKEAEPKEPAPKEPSQSQKSDEKPKELTGTKAAPEEPEPRSWSGICRANGSGRR